MLPVSWPQYPTRLLHCNVRLSRKVTRREIKGARFTSSWFQLSIHFSESLPHPYGPTESHCEVKWRLCQTKGRSGVPCACSNLGLLRLLQRRKACKKRDLELTEKQRPPNNSDELSERESEACGLHFFEIPVSSEQRKCLAEHGFTFCLNMEHFTVSPAGHAKP